MTSELGSTADRSVLHLRWNESDEGWGGDAEVALTEVNPNLPARIEWVEGAGEGWFLWVFEEDADVIEDDILIVESHSLALVVERVAEFTTLRSKKFHHYEIRTSEHEWGLARLKAAIV